MKKFNTIQYKRTWCDYLTPCPRDTTIDVGSYECSICPHCQGMGKEIIPDVCDDPSSQKYYERYFSQITGTVDCAYEASETAIKQNRTGFFYSP